MSTYEIRKIKLEIRIKIITQKILSELDFLESVIRNYPINNTLGNSFIQTNVLRYTKYAMKFLLLIYKHDQTLDLHTKIHKKLNEFFNWNKVEIPTILKMQEIIDCYVLKMSSD